VEGDFPELAQPPDLLLVAPGFLAPETVVEVGGEEAGARFPERFARPHEAVEEAERVGTAGHRHEEALAASSFVTGEPGEEPLLHPGGREFAHGSSRYRAVELRKPLSYTAPV
jgi:hypothetical protein